MDSCFQLTDTCLKDLRQTCPLAQQIGTNLMYFFWLHKENPFFWKSSYFLLSNFRRDMFNVGSYLNVRLSDPLMQTGPLYDRSSRSSIVFQFQWTPRIRFLELSPLTRDLSMAIDKRSGISSPLSRSISFRR